MLHAVPGLDQAFGELLVNAGDGPTLVINRDTTNALLIGNEQAVGRYGMTIGSPVSVIDPLGSMAVDGDETLFGQGLQATGKITVDVKRGATVWAPPASLVISQLVASSLPGLIAAAVQSAGVPPIDIPAALFISLGTDIPASPGTVGTGHISVSKYQSYTLIMKVGNGHNNVNTVPYVRVTFAWSLASDNFDPVHVEDWVVPVGPFSFTFNFPVYGHGPCYSDTLDITFSSYDTVINTFILGVFGSFRARQRSIMRGAFHWLAGGAPNEALGLGTDGILASTSVTNLAAGASSTPILVNLWHGLTTLYLTSADAGIDDLECHIQPQPASALPNQSDIVLSPDGGGNSSVLPGILLPRRVCTMFFTNEGGITIPSVSASLVMDGVSE